MIVVLLTTLTLVAAFPPKVAAAPVTKFVPVIVTVVPPSVDPDEGDTLLTVGEEVAVYVNALERDPL